MHWRAYLFLIRCQSATESKESPRIEANMEGN